MNKIYFFIKKNWRSICSIFGFLIIWEASVRLGLIQATFISTPSEVFIKGWSLISMGKISLHFLASIKTLAAGYLLAALGGITIGLFIGSYNKLYEYAKPHIFILSSLPMAAVLSLIIIWFGIGFVSKVAIVFLMAVSPILINTIDGVKNTDSRLLKMSRSFGAGQFFTLRTVTLFNSLPFIFSGLRVAVGRSIVGLVIGEVFGYGLGLGYLVSFYGNTFQTARLIFLIFILLLMGLVMIGLIAGLEKLIIKWRH